MTDDEANPQRILSPEELAAEESFPLAEDPIPSGPVEFGPADLEPLLRAWRSIAGSEPPLTVRVALDERFVLFLEQPKAWEPHGWPRRFDLVDLTSEPVVARLELPEGWLAAEIVPGCGYVFRPLHSTLIDSVAPGGASDRAGLAAGDRIRTIDGTPVATEADVRERLAAWLAEKKPLFAKRRDVEIGYERAGASAVTRTMPATKQTATGLDASLEYVTDLEEHDVVTPSQLMYCAIEAVRQLAGTMPATMYALVVPRDPVAGTEAAPAAEAVAAPETEAEATEVP